MRIDKMKIIKTKRKKKPWLSYFSKKKRKGTKLLKLTPTT